MHGSQHGGLLFLLLFWEPLRYLAIGALIIGALAFFGSVVTGDRAQARRTSAEAKRRMSVGDFIALHPSKRLVEQEVTGRLVFSATGDAWLESTAPGAKDNAPTPRLRIAQESVSAILDAMPWRESAGPGLEVFAWFSAKLAFVDGEPVLDSIRQGAIFYEGRENKFKLPPR